jgi:hypothetical protein
MTPPPAQPSSQGRYRVLWTLVLVSPDPPGSRMTIGIRAGSQDQAIRTALQHRPGWSIARDEWDNPLVFRHPPVAE